MGDPVVKLTLLGNGSVGKSSIIARFVADGFEKQYKQTVGLDFFEKKLHFPRDQRVVLEVWDIGGQNMTSKMLDKYLFGANLIFLCYDVTDAKSFADLDDWLRVVPTLDRSKRCVYLVGNKIDLRHLRVVSLEAHNAFVSKHKLHGGFLLSAQSGDNVLRSVHQIAARAIGVELSEYELQFYDAPVVATVVNTVDHRTTVADAIEAEDLRLEEAKRRKKAKRASCRVM
ncbi:hypothetical protein SPRG_08379 [Saprolegnia parasitica CBS 223.65]|uniref:Uncharacterized protein n=1 Tax=Saprolegnia parasitica (strain CBS 223.65) TaxID=695850 RepID=A0A067CAW4_SAPPC|nr:hypothetical protein SPRG_08379 [Saprolegnia parasitica CBS 223.65]KDO26305.1 hypothetical protein SPRG_08379 [Saprolegnia parasitica CBS 223.65]|eukprot:XP_012203008.1 hypothetical protein SPRG_08379 [Saprolegnia parasitica CBS 223.65]